MDRQTVALTHRHAPACPRTFNGGAQHRGFLPQRPYIAAHAGKRPIWVTETGLATWDLATSREAKFELQSMMIGHLIAAPGKRFYFYSAIDLDPRREAIEGFHVDENEYHMGLITHDGRPKPAFYRLKNSD